jgi:integrase
MAKPFTPIGIRALRPRSGRYEISDGGCQGLRVVVQPSGRKSFILRFRFRGLQRKLTLGPCLTERGVAETNEAPEPDTPLSLAAARELATKALRQAKAGNDPAAGKQRRKREERAAESDTLAAIADEFLRRRGPELRTFSQRRADLALLCDRLGPLPIGEITRGQYTRAFDHVADHNGPVRADRVLSATKALLNWYAERSDFVSPLGRGGRRTSIRERARTRVLTDSELQKVWIAAEQDKTPFGGFARFVLLTGCRRNEAAGLRYDELSEGGTVWIIPGRRAKGKRDVVLPLSKAAQLLVAAQPVRGPYVFSATGEFPLGDHAHRMDWFRRASGVAGVTIHDWRRTSRTLLSRCGVRPDVAERLLGHAVGGHLAVVYDQHRYEREMREGAEALAVLIERIVRPPAVPDLAAERERRKQPRRR